MANSRKKTKKKETGAMPMPPQIYTGFPQSEPVLRRIHNKEFPTHDYVLYSDKVRIELQRHALNRQVTLAERSTWPKGMLIDVALMMLLSSALGLSATRVLHVLLLLFISKCTSKYLVFPFVYNHTQSLLADHFVPGTMHDENFEGYKRFYKKIEVNVDTRIKQTVALMMACTVILLILEVTNRLDGKKNPLISSLLLSFFPNYIQLALGVGIDKLWDKVLDIRHESLAKNHHVILGDLFETYYFEHEIHSKAIMCIQLKKTNHLPLEKVVKIVSLVYQKNNLPVIYADKERGLIYLTAEAYSPRDPKFTVLRLEIMSYINGYAQLKAFINELTSILKVINHAHYRLPNIENDGKLAASFLLSIADKNDKQAIKQILIGLYGVKIKVENEAGYLLISGTSPVADSVKFQSAITNMQQHFTSPLIAVSSPVLKRSDADTNSPSFNKNKKEKLNSSSFFTSQEPASTAINCKWISGNYNSNNNNNQIKPVTGRGLPANKFFLLFNLKAEDFGRDRTQSHEKFNSQAANAKLAPSRKGAEGLVFCDTWIRGNDGIPFHAKAKLKLIGTTHGNERVYFGEETNEQGQRLYVSKAYIANAHK